MLPSIDRITKEQILIVYMLPETRERIDADMNLQSRSHETNGICRK
jgi:hypothetical protein